MRLPPRLLVASALCALAASAVAQDLALARLAAKCDSEIPWITDGFASPDSGGPTPIPAKGPDRVALLEQALKRAADEKKLVFWYVPRIDGPQVYRSPLLDDYLKVVAFTDQRFTSLVNARFVPLRMAADKAIGAKTGVKSLDWVEPAFAILGPDGTLLRRFDRIRTFSAEKFRALLVAELEKHAALAPVPAALEAALADAGDDPRKLVAAAGAAAQAGWNAGVDRAAEKLAAVGAEAEGRLFRIQTSPDLETAVERVRAFSESVAKLPADAPLRPFAAYAEAKTALYEGRFADAEKAFKDLAAPKSPAALRPDSLYRLAYCQLRLKKTRDAEQTYRKICDEFPEQTYAWRAATNLLTGRDTTPIGPAFHHFEDMTMPTRDDAAWVAGAADTSRPRELAEADRVVSTALGWLLDRQDMNGQWKDSRYAYWSSPRILPNTWTAITGVVAASLLDWREVAPDRVDAALKSADRALFNPKNMDRGQNEEIYADTFRALYLTKKLARKDLSAEEADASKKRLDEVLKEIARQQDDKGFFGHEYPNPFTTGAALVVADKARRAGGTTGDALFAEGAKALRGVRNEQGAFAYGAGRAPRKGDEGLKDSVARSPVCEHALMAATGGGDEALVASFDNWDAHFARLAKVRVCDFHSDGELAGFFFWHATYFASEAAKALPAAKREARLAAIRDVVLKIGEIDGSFVDSHEMGKSYGTGMALLTLKNVLPPKPE